ncbi:hypothetical protein [Cohnella yongneupensis]|uniref:Type II secretion system protein GspF domain-containing protein n=1 Tax=Cohnella yongneupensis TaxID=425006 RepID=A0ABW0R0S9_9BACL
MTGYSQGITAVIGWVLQFVVIFISIAALLKALTASRNRWRIHLRDWRLHRTPQWWLAFWRTSQESTALQERRVLLAGCGIRYQPEAYLAHRRFAICLLVLASGGAYGLGRIDTISAFSTWNAVLTIVVCLVVAVYDHAWLYAFRRYRTDRIRKEIVTVSNQLLYYVGSRLHIHAKLMKCLPLTRSIRAEMSLLLNEWYQDADVALKKFKERLGTDEAYGFAETMRSLRLDESEQIYELLREVVREYKNKIELAKNSRKETTSYLLFVLAGLPILYMFQLFLYPWVQEAAKLFEALNP